MNKFDIKKAFSFVDKKRIIQLAKELIKIPSVTGEERAIAIHVSNVLEALGLEVEFLGSEDRPIIISTLNREAETLLAFNGHLDTKPIANQKAWNYNPFDPIIVDGKLYGRGSSDCKSPCAVIIHVMEILKNLKINCSVSAHLVPDEEKGGVYGTGLIASEMKHGRIRCPDYVIVGEKSNLKMRIAERGSFEFSIRFKGQASHSARLLYSNAIAKAAKGVLVLQKKIDKYHEWVGYSIRNVTSIHASSPSGIPAECVITVRHGLNIDETADTVVSEVTEELDEAGKDDPYWFWELEAKKDDQGNFIYRPPNYTSPNSKLVKAFFHAIPLAMGKKPELFDDYAGCTDGRFYRYAGIQTVGFGAIGGNHHAPNEFVDVNSLVTLAKVYLATILTLVEI